MPALKAARPTRREQPDVIAPEVLDASTWYAVRRELDARSNKPRTQPAKTDSVLTGLLRCGVCEASMVHGTGKTYRGEPERRYRCGPKGHVALNADRLDAEVTARFLDDLGDVQMRRDVTPLKRDVTAELADAERGIAGLTALAMDDPDNAALLAPRLTELRKKRDALREERDTPQVTVWEDTGETFRDVWERNDNMGRRGLLRQAGVTVTVMKRTGSKKVWDPRRIHVGIADPDTAHLALALEAAADDGSGPEDPAPVASRLAFAA